MSLVDKPGFKDTDVGWFANEWLLTTLGGACSGRLQTGPFGSQLHADEYQDYGVPVLMPKDLIGFRADLTSAARISPERADELARHKLKSGDLLFSRRGDVARFALIDSRSEGALCGTGCLRATPSENHIPLFLAYFLQLDAIKDWLEKNAVGQTMPNMNTSILAALPLVLPPSKAEQQRIAAILTAVDDKLDVIARQIEATQALKQGLMQTLFSRGVGTQDADGRWVPHTEFKDSELGEIPATWEVRSLNDVADNLDRQRVPLKQADRAQRQGKVPYYGASGVIDWIDDFLFDGDFILLGEDGENVLSRKLPLAFRATGRIWVNNHAHVLRPKVGYDIQFLVELLESLDYSTLASGTAQPKITQQALNQLRFAVPPLDEQVRIGSLLVTVAEKTDLLRLRRERYGALKRGLMQKLLTGEWRVKVDAKMDA